MPSDFGSDILVQHGEFVRSLARALVREPHLADDVAQETWMRWFTRPPADRSRPRAWLARVTSGLAHNKQRSKRRRADVESGAPPAEPRTTPLDSCLEAERIGRVVAAVRTLEVPYRDVILARYFHGLSVGELARESGTGEDTLRSRERRALELLRAKLDREFGGREAWAVGLGVLARRAAGVAGPGAAAVWLVASGLLAMGSAVALWVKAGSASEPVAANAASLVATMPASSIDPEPGAREPLGAAPTGFAASSLGGTSGSSSSAITSMQADVRATFLLHDGRPAAGAEWSFSGWRRTGEDQRPEEWSDRSGTLDASGLFVLSFDPPPEFLFSLDVKAPGHAVVAWMWSKVAPDQTIDLGAVTLPRGATITGRLVDASGAPILGQKWDIGSATVGLRGAGSREDSYAGARLDPDTGEFRLEDVHPGRNRLRASSRIGDSFEGPTVEVVSGETLMVDLVYRGASVTDRITVSTSCRPFRSVLGTPAAEHVRLRLPDGSTRPAARDEGTSSRYSFFGLVPGSYRLEIDDPRFVPFFLDTLTPGTDVRAPLEPSAEVRLSVVDAAWEPVAPERIEVEFLNVNFFPNTVVVHEGQGGFGGTLRLFPGECLLHVEARGVRASLAVVALGAGEVRPLTLRFGTQPALAGRIVRANGAPVAGRPCCCGVALRLLLPELDENDMGPSLSAVWGSLGTLELPDGATLERDFPLTEFPGTLSVNATINGAAMAGLQLSATRQYDGAWQEVLITADPDGRFEPMTLFAGHWSLRLASPERTTWAARLPAEVHVPAAGHVSASFAVETATGTLRFLDSAGQPRANQRICLRLDHPHEQRPWSVKTDENGQATMTLATGIHQASLDGSHSIAITWTTSGPDEPDVRL